MTKRWAYIKQTLPPVLWAGLFIFGTFLCFLPALLARQWGIEITNDFKMVPVVWFAAGAAVFGFFRVVFFHPFYKQDYRIWLSLSPYDGKKRLPFGPIHLVETDFLIVGLLYLVVYVIKPELAMLPVISFLGVYLFLHWIGLGESQGHIFVLILFLLPFVYYPFRSFTAAVIVLLAFYVIFYLNGFGLKKFPWETSWWKSDPLDKLRKQSLRHTNCSWPYYILGYRSGHKFGWGQALFTSTLLTWWVHVLWWALDSSSVYLICGYIVIPAVFLRTLIYCAACRPPISLLGRICNFRLVTPGYDKVFAAPIYVVVFGVAIPFVLHHFGVSNRLTFETTIFVVLLVIFGMGPRLSVWKLTSRSRLVRSKLTESQSSQIHRRQSPVAERIQSKFKFTKPA